MMVSFLVPKENAGSREEFELNRGTTENVYVLYEKGGSPDDGPLTLIDVPEARFLQVFLEQMAPYLPRLTGLVLTHLGEEHFEVLTKLCEEAEKASGSRLKVYTSEAGKSILANFVGKEVDKIDLEIIDDNSFISCRNEGRLDVVCTSTGKYPDLMNAFDEATGTLFSGKFFAAHSNYDIPSEDYDPSWSDTAEDWHHYFDCNFFTSSAQDGIRRIFQITADNAGDGVGLDCPDVERLAPFHGPVVRGESWKLMAKYEAWLERKLATVTEGSAVVMHASAYGNTFKMAEAIARGLENSGINTELMNVEFTDAKDIRKAVEQCDGFAVGSPTLGGQMPIQIKEALGIILKSAQGGSKQGASMRAGSVASKQCGAFGSYGWSGEAPEEVNQRLKDGGFEIAFDPIRCKFQPTPEMLTQCEAAGAALAQRIAKGKSEQLKTILAAEEGAGMSKLESRSEDEIASTKSIMQAFGQIMNSSCMLTFPPAEEGGESMRVPVSWVSQASFTPPGLMIAVEKKGLDAWLSTSPEEQLNDLFKKYDVDDSGKLDREEVDLIITEMLGAKTGSAQADLLKAKRDEAWNVLDEDGSGLVDRDEFRAAAKAGPFADILARERKMASLETMLSREETLQFTLCMLPEGMPDAEAMSAPQHKKKKAKNGCAVLAGCTSFVECEVKSLMSAGTSSVMYAEITEGDLVEEGRRTELVRADHVAIDHEAQDTAAQGAGADAELVSAGSS
jgi:flavorubredoxin/flavin reductase (DIM6/NTAB) family NADH-FMN oxidoreductase RutF